MGLDKTRAICVLIEMSFPMVAGMVSELAEEEKPAAPVVLAATSFTKSNLKAASGRMAILEISVGRSKSCEMSSAWAATLEKAIAERIKNREIIVRGERGEEDEGKGSDEEEDLNKIL